MDAGQRSGHGNALINGFVGGPNNAGNGRGLIRALERQSCGDSRFRSLAHQRPRSSTDRTKVSIFGGVANISEQNRRY
jgi:hypothetical protein